MALSEHDLEKIKELLINGGNCSLGITREEIIEARNFFKVIKKAIEITTTIAFGSFMTVVVAIIFKGTLIQAYTEWIKVIPKP